LYSCFFSHCLTYALNITQYNFHCTDVFCDWQESLFETQTQTRGNTASGSGASIPKAASSVNMMDDLSAIFGGTSVFCF
jgi:hypothetical protein